MLLFLSLLDEADQPNGKASGRHFDIRSDRLDCYGRDELLPVMPVPEEPLSQGRGRGERGGGNVAPSARPLIRPFGLRGSPEREKGCASAESAVDLTEATRFRTEGQSRGAARLRRRAKRAPLTALRLRKCGLHEIDGAVGRREVGNQEILDLVALVIPSTSASALVASSRMRYAARAARTAEPVATSRRRLTPSISTVSSASKRTSISTSAP